MNPSLPPPRPVLPSLLPLGDDVSPSLSPFALSPPSRSLHRSRSTPAPPFPSPLGPPLPCAPSAPPSPRALPPPPLARPVPPSSSRTASLSPPPFSPAVSVAPVPPSVSALSKLLRQHCSFVEKGAVYDAQALYECRTCELECSRGCCQLCAFTCHAGHTVRLVVRAVPHFCDCGADDPKGHEAAHKERLKRLNREAQAQKAEPRRAVHSPAIAAHPFPPLLPRAVVRASSVQLFPPSPPSASFLPPPSPLRPSPSRSSASFPFPAQPHLPLPQLGDPSPQPPSPFCPSPSPPSFSPPSSSPLSPVRPLRPSISSPASIFSVPDLRRSVSVPVPAPLPPLPPRTDLQLPAAATAVARAGSSGALAAAVPVRGSSSRLSEWTGALTGAMKWIRRSISARGAAGRAQGGGGRGRGPVQSAGARLSVHRRHVGR